MCSTCVRIFRLSRVTKDWRFTKRFSVCVHLVYCLTQATSSTTFRNASAKNEPPYSEGWGQKHTYIANPRSHFRSDFGLLCRRKAKWSNQKNELCACLWSCHYTRAGLWKSHLWERTAETISRTHLSFSGKSLKDSLSKFSRRYLAHGSLRLIILHSFNRRNIDGFSKGLMLSRKINCSWNQSFAQFHVISTLEKCSKKMCDHCHALDASAGGNSFVIISQLFGYKNCRIFTLYLGGQVMKLFPSNSPPSDH